MRALATLLLLAAPAAAQWLYAPQPLATGDNPRRVVAADLDGNGAMDLVTLNGGPIGLPPVTLTVLAGDGGGVFGGSATYPFVGGADDLQLGDVTGDGAPDAVTVVVAGQLLTLRPGNGLGGFLAPTSIATGGPSMTLALVDLDLDGALDAVAGNGVTDTMSVFMNDGAALQAPVLVVVDNTAATLRAGLVDGDAFPDMLVMGFEFESVRLMPGLGNGAFGAKQIVYATTGPCGTLGDLNGDGRPDYVKGLSGASGAADIVEVALNDGTGHFAFASQATTGWDVRAVGTGDFDLDGKLDVVAACEDDDDVQLLRGDGAGSLLPGPRTPVEKMPAALVVADLSGDGRPDVAVASPAQDTVHLLLAHEARVLLGTPKQQSLGNNAQGLALGDLDGDGDLDAISSTTNQLDHINRLLGDGLGGFLTKKNFTTGDDPRAPQLADMDLDGDLDAVVSLYIGQALEILAGSGSGNFSAPLHVPTPVPVLLMGVADVDGDLVPDAIVTTTTPPFELQVWRGNGTGGLQAPTSFPLPAAPGAAVGYLGDDGLPDVLLTFSATQEVLALLGDGKGGFSFGAGQRTGNFPRMPSIADVDGDGHGDGIVFTGLQGEASATVALLRGDAAGALSPPQHVPMPQLASLAVGDLNGDGRADVFGSGLHSVPSPLATIKTLYVLEADEQGLRPPSVLADDWGYNSAASGDLDGDGRAEVLAANDTTNNLQAAPNLSTPHPWRDHDHALAGVHGEPTLTAVSWAQPGTPGALRLVHAAPGALAVLFVSPVSTPTPFKGGLLFPVPPALATPLLTDALGRLELPWSSWPALGSGSVYWLQAAVADVEAPHDVSLSNALQLIQP